MKAKQLAKDVIRVRDLIGTANAEMNKAAMRFWCAPNGDVYYDTHSAIEEIASSGSWR